MAHLLLALPRLHAVLAEEEGRRLVSSLPENMLTLWPGLPEQPEKSLLPDLPWTPAQAAACLADFERSAREGAHGLAVTHLTVRDMQSAAAGLSPEEQDALARLQVMETGEEPEEDDSPTARQLRRESAQRTLLLNWLQEKQYLELNELSRLVASKQAGLAGILGEGRLPKMKELAAEEPPVPAWRALLDAAAVLLEKEIAEGLRIVALDADMAEALAQIPASRRVETEGDEVPEGFKLISAPVNAVPGMAAVRRKQLLHFLVPVSD